MSISHMALIMAMVHVLSTLSLISQFIFDGKFVAMTMYGHSEIKSNKFSPCFISSYD